MEVLTILIPVSLIMGLGGLVAFVWTLRKGMYEDPDGDSQRILSTQYDDKPKPLPSKD
jgi:cbb3-type cytochrome oxidase maturation protein